MLHYVYDPLCGWCYGAAPLIQVAATMSAITLHAGGMMTGSRRQPVTPALRQFVKSHDERIAKMTGQTFGDAYTDGLLADNSAVFDSTPPIAAILAAEQLAGKGLSMLSALQQAHYQQGRKIAEPLTLFALADSLGINQTDFTAAFVSNMQTTAQAHMQDTRMLMTQWQLQGFPSVVLSKASGLVVVDLSPWFGKPQDFGQWLSQQLQQNN